MYIYISTEGLDALEMHLLLSIALKLMCVYYVYIYIYIPLQHSLFCGIQRLCVFVYQCTFEHICVSVYMCVSGVCSRFKPG